MALDPSVDLDAGSGADLSGWPHVLQCLSIIFATRFGERIMREWFGSMVPKALGEPLNTQTVVPFFAAMASAVEQWEPRFRITRVIPESVGRDGRLMVTLEGEYRPRALLGDFTPDGARRVSVLGNSGGQSEVRNG